MNKDQNNFSRAPTQRADAWNAISEGWHDWIPQMRNWYAPATNLMLDLADIISGDHILDIAAGDCDQSIAAAERVGPNGYVLAIDMASEMLELGARSARDAGVSNLETRVMDVGNLDFPDNSFDAAICRFGLMLFPDPVGSLVEIARVLKETGRLSVVVYADEGDPGFIAAVSTVRQFLNLPEPEVVTDSLGDPNKLFKTFASGGFHEIETHLLNLPVRMDSADDCVRYLQSTSPTIASLISDLGPNDRRKVWDNVHEVLRVIETEAGFEIDHKVIVGAGSVAQH
jgi:SAM-dependent methyltransferase